MKHVAVLLPALVVAVTLTLFAGRTLIADGPVAVPSVAPAAGGVPAAVLPESVSPAGRPVIDGTSAGPPTSDQLAHGARVYRSLCAACHLPDGRGVPGVTPPLAAADYLLADRERAIRIVLRGISGPLLVNHAGYDGQMPPLGAVLSDRQAADVLTYVFNRWGNTGDAFAVEWVARIRAEAPVPP
jgi:mono/diheme cytochrome c family protein